MSAPAIHTLGELKASGYTHKTIKEEIRDNLIQQIKRGSPMFKGIHGYDKTVRPQMERAMLAGHNMLLLGLRGQAKTRMARKMVELLDEYVPVIAESELFEDPLSPITSAMIDLVDELGDDLPIRWIHRSDRMVEKLATPDVSVADLIGDLDPIKAAAQKLSYADEKAIHFGLVPRAHRSIFILNELPDLQPRIQVALFNILQERDIQIRGFNLRIPLDIQFVFTANPEDYTNRGSIVTPLKDRIESQILTHYPMDHAENVNIIEQEIRVDQSLIDAVTMPIEALYAIATITDAARHSHYVDQTSGVSARMSITAAEHLYAACYHRMLLQGVDKTELRLADMVQMLPAMTGKVELDYEGEQKGSEEVGIELIQGGLFHLSAALLPEVTDDEDADDPYEIIRLYFSDDHEVVLLQDLKDSEYRAALEAVPGLQQLANNAYENKSFARSVFGLELILHHLVGAQELALSYTGLSTNYYSPLKGYDPDVSF